MMVPCGADFVLAPIELPTYNYLVRSGHRYPFVRWSFLAVVVPCLQENFQMKNANVHTPIYRARHIDDNALSEDCSIFGACLATLPIQRNRRPVCVDDRVLCWLLLLDHVVNSHNFEFYHLKVVPV